MTHEASPSNNADAGRGLSEGLGLAPERATCECCSFMHAATREAQAFASHYADEVLELRAQMARLRTALLDANQICRSAWSISNRIATEYSTNEMGTYFGAFSERTHESLKRQHEVILATGGYPKPDGA